LFKKTFFGGKLGNLGIVTIRRILHPQTATLAFHGINGDSAGNNHIKNEESITGIFYFAGNYQLIDKESTGRMAISPRIASSETRNPLVELDSSVIYQIIDEKLT
jgi:hypothetical protein